jgi:hypothetical protein
MRFITTNDLEDWANRVDCKYNLPHLIRKLILATLDLKEIKAIQFSYGEDVQTGGYDGELETTSEKIFIPLGESVWEFGTTNNKKGKADEDYEKRKQNPLDKNPSDVTYVNVNCKKYRDKKKWIGEKKKDNFWKDVRYLDAIDIEQWLELAPTVELWLAEKLKKPTLGIYTVEEYWKLWSENESLKIIPEILLGYSRLKEIEKVKSFLTNNEKVLYIKSITTDEAVAFPLAVFKVFDDLSELDIVVIDNRESFNLFIQVDKPLKIVAKFKLESIDLSSAVQKGHKIIIPISLADEVSSSEKIQLPIISRDTFEKGLQNMGIDSEQVRVLTKSSGRNVSVLKRLLKFDDRTKPRYIEKCNIKDIIPILLLNRFSEDRDGDIEIIEKLSGKTSAEYFQFLRILLNMEDSPVYFINGVWRLVSPTDTWLYLGKYITQHDFILFQEVCSVVLSEILHKYTLPVENRGNYYQTPQNRSKYSSKLKEGICESLVIISAFGNDYDMNSISNVPSYIDNIVQKILEMDILVWRSLSSNLMLLSEASPEVFLKNLERIIKDKSIAAFFEVQESFLHSSNDLAPLLWCLDILAWFPEHLIRVSIALNEIISISPNKFPTSNTPLSNLQSIYRTWYPQTNTDVEDRKKILEILIKKYPETTYGLLYSLVGNTHDTAFHTPRPKWRLFSELREIQVTQREVYYMRGFCFDNIIEMSKGNIKRILSLVDLLDDIEWDKLDKALNVIETSLEFYEIERNQIYHKFRKFIGRHRSYPTAHWALSNDILCQIENVAIKFKPNDVLSELYLFEEHHPEFIEGRQGKDFNKHDEEILSRRLKFIESIIDKYGINEVFKLAVNTEHSYIYGHVLAISDKLSYNDKQIVYRQIESIEEKHQYLVKEFIRISENKTSLQAQIEALENLMKFGLSTQGIVKFLNSLRGKIDLWKFISDLKSNEVAELYWKSQQGFLYTENKEELFYALDKLQEYDKPITFLNTLGWGGYVHKDSLTSEEILVNLEKISLTEYDDSSRFDHDHFRNLLDLLYSKNDYDIERGAKIEMKFIFVFTGGGSYNPKPKNLYKLMSQKPEEYFGILSQVYLPNEDELREAERQKIKSDPIYQQILSAGWEIFDSFNVVPSMQEDGCLNSEVLKKWVNEVRELALKNYRVEVTDNSIGKLLAKYPINIKENKGFPVEIYDVIEEIGTEEFKNAFRMQISNNLGLTTRGAFEGGDIERSKANYFNSLFEETKFTHPNVSLIFKDLKDGFLSQAKWEDENALLRSLE